MLIIQALLFCTGTVVLWIKLRKTANRGKKNRENVRNCLVLSDFCPKIGH